MRNVSPRDGSSTTLLDVNTRWSQPPEGARPRIEGDGRGGHRERGLRHPSSLGSRRPCCGDRPEEAHPMRRRSPAKAVAAGSLPCAARLTHGSTGVVQRVPLPPTTISDASASAATSTGRPSRSRVSAYAATAKRRSPSWAQPSREPRANALNHQPNRVSQRTHSSGRCRVRGEFEPWVFGPLTSRLPELGGGRPCYVLARGRDPSRVAEHVDVEQHQR